VRGGTAIALPFGIMGLIVILLIFIRNYF